MLSDYQKTNGSQSTNEHFKFMEMMANHLIHFNAELIKLDEMQKENSALLEKISSKYDKESEAKKYIRYDVLDLKDFLIEATKGVKCNTISADEFETIIEEALMIVGNLQEKLGL